MGPADSLSPNSRLLREAVFSQPCKALALWWSPQGRPYPACWVSALLTAVRGQSASLLWLVWPFPSLPTTVHIWVKLKIISWRRSSRPRAVHRVLRGISVPRGSCHLSALVHFNIFLPSSFPLALGFGNSLPFLRRSWLPFSFSWHLDFYLFLFPHKMTEFFFLWTLKGEIKFLSWKKIFFLKAQPFVAPSMPSLLPCL